MKNVLIVEKQTEKLIAENAGNGRQLLKGIFTEFDVENRNKRFYTANNFVPVMERLLEKKKWGVIYGEFDHPDVFDIAGKNASHVVEELTYNSTNNRIDGSIALLSTHWGKEAKAIINDGYPLFVSSRAAGITDGNRNVILKELHTYDIVLDPGFSSAQVSINESCGYDENLDINYRIYEMKDDSVQSLHIDNKNDQKTKMDLEFMKRTIADEIAKLEHKFATANGNVSSEEVRSMMEKYESLNEEYNKVKGYLDTFQKKFSLIVDENKKLLATTQKLAKQINENDVYSNHLASSLKSLVENVTEIVERVGDAENMIEYVAENAKANIMLTEEIDNKLTKVNEDLTVTMAFTENVASETYITQKMLEYVANETDVAQQMLEYVAKETDVTQQMLEHNSSEILKDLIYNNYIANKVDGIVGYLEKSEAFMSIKESLNNGETFQPIKEYLGIDDENEIVNSVTQATEENDEDNTEENTDDVVTNSEIPTDAPTGDATATEPVEGTQDDVTATEPESTETEEVTATDDVNTDVINTDVVLPEPVEGTEAPVAEAPIEGTENVDPAANSTQEVPVGPEATVEPVETSAGTDILSALVKILGSNETGVVIEVTPDNKVVIQKSGTEETVETTFEGIERIDISNNIAETVNDLLEEVKKQKITSNELPHFFNFLNENQIADFNALDVNTKDAIKVKMNESEYFSSKDVLDIIGTTLKDKSETYEDKLLKSLPEELKESWGSLSDVAQRGVIVESKYFTLTTTGDMKNFWKTRNFAKALNSNDAVLIKESAKSELNESFSDDYANAFINKMKSF